MALKSEDFVAGKYACLTFTVKDAKTGEPVTDLQPYLGAPAHMLIVRSDLTDAVHAHPEELTTGGPAISFHPLVPAAGDCTDEFVGAWLTLTVHSDLAAVGLTAAVAGALAAALTASGAVPTLPAPAPPWLALVGVLTLVFLAGNLSLQYGAARLPANRTAVIMLTEVVFASLSALALGGGVMTPRLAIGGAFIVAGAFTFLYWDVRLLARREIIPWYPTAPWA